VRKLLLQPSMHDGKRNDVRHHMIPTSTVYVGYRVKKAWPTEKERNTRRRWT